MGPGDVDDDLEGETREECSKYGEVIQVVIYEIPSGVAVEEAVRIFVQFNRVESAVKGNQWPEDEFYISVLFSHQKASYRWGDACLESEWGLVFHSY